MYNMSRSRSLSRCVFVSYSCSLSFSRTLPRNLLPPLSVSLSSPPSPTLFLPQAAKNAVNTKSKLGEDFVEKSEFRALLIYLRRYFELHIMFAKIDKGADHRVSLVFS